MTPPNVPVPPPSGATLGPEIDDLIYGLVKACDGWGLNPGTESPRMTAAVQAAEDILRSAILRALADERAQCKASLVDLTNLYLHTVERLTTERDHLKKLVDAYVYNRSHR